MAREEVRGEDRRVRERLVQELRHRREQLEQRLLAEHLLVVIGFEALGDRPRVGGLVEARLTEADREGLDRAGRKRLGHHRDDRARVDPAAQERAERDVADEPAADCLTQELSKLVDVLVVRAGVAVAVERQVPVLLDRRPSLAPEQVVAAGELRYALEDRAGRRDVFEREVTRETREIELAGAAGMREQRLELGAEQQRVSEVGVVERLLAESVTSEQQAPVLLVPECEREHAVEPLDTARSVILVQVDDHLGVGVRCEAMAALHEIRAQLAVVVDLAVLDDLERAVFVADRLIARVQVDDRQPAKAEADSAPVLVFGDVESLVVRSSVLEHSGHLREHPAVDRGRSDDSTDSAHRGRGRYSAEGPSSKLRRSRTRYTGFACDSWCVRTISSARSPSRNRLKPTVNRNTPTIRDGWR